MKSTGAKIEAGEMRALARRNLGKAAQAYG